MNCRLFLAWASHLSDMAPDIRAPMRTPAMYAVDANWTRKSQPQTKLNYTHNKQAFRSPYTDHFVKKNIIHTQLRIKLDKSKTALQNICPAISQCNYTVSQKSEPPKHFATAAANLHRFKWNFTHTRRHLFLSLTSNFIRIPYSVYEMFNSFKLLSQISVTDTTYFLLTSSVVIGVTSVRVDKQTTCYQKRIEF